MKYKTWIMSNVIELEADNINQAICLSVLYFQTNAPIAVYDTEEKSTLKFPYNSDEVDNILKWLWTEKLKKYFYSVKLI